MAGSISGPNDSYHLGRFCVVQWSEVGDGKCLAVERMSKEFASPIPDATGGSRQVGRLGGFLECSGSLQQLPSGKGARRPSGGWHNGSSCEVCMFGIPVVPT